MQKYYVTHSVPCLGHCQVPQSNDYKDFPHFFQPDDKNEVYNSIHVSTIHHILHLWITSVFVSTTITHQLI